VENVFVVETHVGRNSKQAGGIGGHVQVKFYSFELALPHGDAAIHGAAVNRHHLNSYAVE
jgi:hypothetical protein